MNECQDQTDAFWLERAELALVKARQLRATLERRIAGRGLSEPELALLWACASAPPGGSSQRELAEQLAVSPAQISGLVERLAQLGWLRGRPAPADRRRRLWEPTAAGAALWRSIVDSLNDVEPQRGAA